MTMPRQELVDVSVTRWYHCIASCVRGAKLCGQGLDHRRQWLEDRLQLLVENFAISIGAFAVLEDCLHVVARIDSDISAAWSPAETARRRIAIHPPRTVDLDDQEGTRTLIAQMAKDSVEIKLWRSRLTDLAWFMKALKEPLARIANKEDDQRGAFWENRFKTVAVLDEESLLATCVYVDLRPVATGLATSAAVNPFSSLGLRFRHARQAGKLTALKTAARKTVGGNRASTKLEESLWLCPIDDFRAQGGSREGLLTGFSLGSYLALVDSSSRLLRLGQAAEDPGLVRILARLQTTPDYWNQRMLKLFGQDRLLGSYFAAQRDQLRKLAQAKGRQYLDNLVALGRRRER